MFNTQSYFKTLFFCISLLLSIPSISLTLDPDEMYIDTTEAGNDVFQQIGLEWLRWDITAGLSINAAVDTYGDDGWRLASNVEMADLFNYWEFNAFGTGLRDPIAGFTSNSNINQSTSGNGVPDRAALFEEFFGETSYFCNKNLIQSYLRFGCQQHISALFGNSNSGSYNLADIHISSKPDSTNTNVSFSSDVFGENYTNLSVNWRSFDNGVALVRDIPVTPVPLPSSLTFLGTAFIFFGLWRRRYITQDK